MSGTYNRKHRCQLIYPANGTAPFTNTQKAWQTSLESPPRGAEVRRFTVWLTKEVDAVSAVPDCRVMTCQRAFQSVG